MTPLLGSPPIANTPERELIDRAQAGDVAAFEALAGVHADRLYAVVLRFVGDGCEAEDVLQETLLRAWRGIGRFQGRAMVFTWLYRIAVNESNRALERRVRRRATVPVGEDKAAGVLRLMEALEEDDDVQQVYANFDIPADVLERVSANV